MASMIDPTGKVAHFLYDAVNRPDWTEDPALGVRLFAYDLQDNPNQIIDANGNATAFKYDVHGCRYSNKESRPFAMRLCALGTCIANASRSPRYSPTNWIASRPDQRSCIRRFPLVSKCKSEKKVATIFPDHGIRYLSSVFDPQWLSKRKHMIDYRQSVPVKCNHPSSNDGRWNEFSWGRRSYVEVLGHLPRPKRYDKNA